MFSREQLNSLFQYCLSLTAETAAAEDLLHNSIEKMLKRPRTIEFEMAYARRVIRNRFIDDCRRKNNVEFEPIDYYEPVLLDEKDIEQLLIDQDHVSKLMALLSASEREVLFLWAVEGYSAAEIAAHTDSPRGTILARLFRVRQKIKKIEDSASNKEGVNP